MAIKLMGVPGPKLLSSEASAQTQDFVLMNFPVFFIRNAAEFAQFVQADAANRSKAFFATHPVAARIRTAIIAQRVENVLDVRYFSTTPYRLGPHYVKYSVQPVTCGQSRRVAQAGGSRSHSQNYLRERMAAQLASANACFEFMVQLQTDPATMPIEDPTVEWKETQAPFIDVARIVIPRQRFDSAAQQNFCENLSYTPWHSLAAHRPVGGINRARRTVYEAISRLRHGLNNAAPVEPSGNEHFEP
jgi:catalase